MKVFLQKTWRNPVISLDFRWKSKFSPNSSKICIFKILINYKKKNNIQFFFFLHILILLDLFYVCANFQVDRSIRCRDLRGGPKRPPLMDSSDQNNPMGNSMIRWTWPQNFKVSFSYIFWLYMIKDTSKLLERLFILLWLW